MYYFVSSVFTRTCHGQSTCSPRGVNPDEGYFWSKPGYTVAGSRHVACARHMQMWDTDHVAGSV